MIRLATLEDVKEILNIVHEFYSSTIYKSLPWNLEKAVTMIEHYITDPESVVLLTEQNGVVSGIIAGTCAEMPFTSVRISAEVVWYVRPEFRKSRDGLLLLKAYEYWAKEVVKVPIAQTVALSPEVEKIYQKRNYEKLEVAFAKVL